MWQTGTVYLRSSIHDFLLTSLWFDSRTSKSCQQWGSKKVNRCQIHRPTFLLKFSMVPNLLNFFCEKKLDHRDGTFLRLHPSRPFCPIYFQCSWHNDESSPGAPSKIKILYCAKNFCKWFSKSANDFEGIGNFLEKKGSKKYKTNFLLQKRLNFSHSRRRCSKPIFNFCGVWEHKYVLFSHMSCFFFGIIPINWYFIKKWNVVGESKPYSVCFMRPVFRRPQMKILLWARVFKKNGMSSSILLHEA